MNARSNSFSLRAACGLSSPLDQFKMLVKWEGADIAVGMRIN